MVMACDPAVTTGGGWNRAARDFPSRALCAASLIGHIRPRRFGDGGAGKSNVYLLLAMRANP